MEEYTLKISPRMLELLSRDLYTNMYFVFAELIANAYDADAENVYLIIDDHRIAIEDDGKGMSYGDLQNNYLTVGQESRDSETVSRTTGKKRLKMGRKGIGKLAALSISDGFKIVTICNGEERGVFIPKKIDHDDETLKKLRKEDYSLTYIKTKGTAVIMEDPIIKLPKQAITITRNLGQIFPNNIKDFTIHIVFHGKHEILNCSEDDVLQKLGSLLIIGDEKNELINKLPNNENIIKEKIEKPISKIQLKNNSGQEEELPINIYGWIGTYKTTADTKKEINEFSDNYLAIYSHEKMGQRNILGVVGRNRVYESYIVGNLFIDAFEKSNFPDMASTNRQGYNEGDPRWGWALQEIRKLVDKAVKQHGEYAKKASLEKNKIKLEKKIKKEEELNNQLLCVGKSMADSFKYEFSNTSIKDETTIGAIVNKEINKMKKTLGFKTTVDANKKKILISQTLLDKKIADVVYYMLLRNGVPKEDILYSNSEDPECNLPEINVYDYLRQFFVNSVSTEMIYVLFITSKNVINIDKENPSYSWGVLMEIGAAWVTQKDHWIFNINDFKPEAPLNTFNKWVQFGSEKDNITLAMPMVNSFCNKIIKTCIDCGYSPKSFEINRKWLIEDFVNVYNP